MTYNYKGYIVEAETDFIDDDGIAKVKAVLWCLVGIDSVDENLFPPTRQQVIVINLNSQTGVEMDEQGPKQK